MFVEKLLISTRGKKYLKKENLYMKKNIKLYKKKQKLKKKTAISFRIKNDMK